MSRSGPDASVSGHRSEQSDARLLGAAELIAECEALAPPRHFDVASMHETGRWCQRPGCGRIADDPVHIVPGPPDFASSEALRWTSLAARRVRRARATRRGAPVAAAAGDMSCWVLDAASARPRRRAAARAIRRARYAARILATSRQRGPGRRVARRRGSSQRPGAKRRMSSSPACKGCGSPLPPASGHGRPRKWCSEACRRRTLYAGRCADCGAPTSGSEGRGPRAPQRCQACAGTHAAARSRERAAPRRALIERLWAEGKTVAEIGELMGWSATARRSKISRLRQLGYSLPHRADRASPRGTRPSPAPAAPITARRQAPDTSARSPGGRSSADLTR